MVLAVMASPAWAQTETNGVEYRWSELFSQSYAATNSANLRHGTRMSAVQNVMARVFVGLDASAGATAALQSTVDFRRADAEFALPEAFRRPRQARLSFRLRF